MSVGNSVEAFLCLIFLCSCPSYGQDIVLNTPQVLLPYLVKGSCATTYVLKAPNGCFKW